MTDSLEKIAAAEARLRVTPMTRVLRVIGRTRAFARIYRVIGPIIDPWLMRRSDLIGRLYGLPTLLLTTVGAKSGARRTSPLLYVRDGEAFAVVGTNFGQFHHPAWTANLLANPNAEIEVWSQQVNVHAEQVQAQEWDRLFGRFVEIYPGYRDYLGRCGGRKPRLFLLRPA
ncbi:MAG: nitroreductase family deazaflavin-dependent oxidoreductase [Armatimonadetes bacterium]|nr:nitroreductase family deazaflavin-dependent oxidoreductase [Armatimonadota bacterium]